MEKILLPIVLILFAISNVYAIPVVNSVSGKVIHRGSITVSSTATNFGTKSPAKPLWWDSGEGATEDSIVPSSGEIEHVISTLTGNNKHYKTAYPTNITEDSGIRNIHYREIGYRNVTTPHQYSNIFMAGGHDDQYDCIGGIADRGANVGVTISDGDVHQDWYVSYYITLDPLWPELTDENYKFFNWETVSPYGMYSDMIYDSFTSCSGGYNNLRRNPGCRDGYVAGPIVNGFDIPSCNWYESDGYPAITYDTNVHNYAEQWVKRETLMRNGESEEYLIHKHDNVDLVNTLNDEDCELDSYVKSRGVGGVTIEGFWKKGTCDYGHYLDDDAWRYLDDVYVDSTFSRVVIANNSSYSSATIIEPQIPSSWSTSSITATVNVGRLPDGPAYLFVCDSNNDCNSTGKAVTVESDPIITN